MAYSGQTWGSSWRDFDEDGLVDVFVSHHFTYPEPVEFAPSPKVPASLYRNIDGARFNDLGPERLGRIPGDWHGASWADFDGDGDADLLIARGGASGLLRRGPITDRDRLLNTNLLFVQEAGELIERAEELGLALPWQRGRRASWFDIDLDGRLDAIFAQAGGGDPSDILYLQSETGAFVPCPAPLPGLGPADSFGVAFLFRGFADGERYLQFSGAPGKLYQQSRIGDCAFIEVPPDENLGARHTYDLLLADITGDLRLDYFGPTKVGGSYIRRSTPRLVSVGLMGSQSLGRLNLRVQGSAMAIVRPASGANNWTDPGSPMTFLGASGASPSAYQFRLDPSDARFHARFDQPPQEAGFFVWLDPAANIWSFVVNKGRSQPFYLEIVGTERLDIVGAPPALPDPVEGASDVLYIQGDESWTRAPDDFGLAGSKTSCVSATAADFDNDMDIDIFMGCADGYSSRPYRLYENTGDRLVLTEPALARDTYGAGLMDSVSAADFDNDGFLDILVTRGQAEIMAEHGPLTLLRNLGNGNNWVKLRLVGVKNARDAFGSQVYLKAGDRIQLGYASGGIRMTAQDEPTLHFGLGRHTHIDDIIVQWPDGSLERFDLGGVNRRILLREGTGRSMGHPELLAARSRAERNRAIRFLLLDPSPSGREAIAWSVQGEATETGDATTYEHLFKAPGRYEVIAEMLDRSGRHRRASARVDVY